jgi:hypothetical protein
MKKILLGIVLCMLLFVGILTLHKNYVKAEPGPFHKKRECLFRPDLKCAGAGTDCVFEDPCGNGSADM